jgi:hypothetical protein
VYVQVFCPCPKLVDNQGAPSSHEQIAQDLADKWPDEKGLIVEFFGLDESSLIDFCQSIYDGGIESGDREEWERHNAKLQIETVDEEDSADERIRTTTVTYENKMMVERKVWLEDDKKSPDYQFDTNVLQTFANNLAENNDNYIDITNEFGDLTIETFLQTEKDHDEVYAFCKELWEGGSRRTELKEGQHLSADDRFAKISEELVKCQEHLDCPTVGGVDETKWMLDTKDTNRAPVMEFRLKEVQDKKGRRGLYNWRYV